VRANSGTQAVPLTGLPAPERDFGSDNRSSVAPIALAALIDANHERAASYGEDPHTRDAARAVAHWLDHDVEITWVPTGTAANIVGIGALLDGPGSCVLCPSDGHVRVDEAGAIERAWGVPLIPVPVRDGKLTVTDVAASIAGLRGNGICSPAPCVLVLTQTSELGRVYAPEEIEALCRLAHEHGLRVHVDGARWANAVVANDALRNPFALGVDTLALGGTKNGQGPVEALVSRTDAPQIGRRVRRGAKQLGYTASKLRYWTAPLAASITSGEYDECARTANLRAAELADALTARGVAPIYPVEANLVYVRISVEHVNELEAWCHVSPWDASGLVRLACSWDHTPTDVERLADGLAALTAAH
jgi:threonine aldolase